MFVSSMEEEAAPEGRFIWKYQKKLLEAACVDVSKDSEAEIATPATQSHKMLYVLKKVISQN